MISAYHAEQYQLYFEKNGKLADKPSPLVDFVEELCRKNDMHSVLDYGSGFARQFELFLPKDIRVQSYDPGVPSCEKRPEPADMVVCNHMLEHVEGLGEAADIIEQLIKLAGKYVYIAVSLESSTKLLPDGTPWHTVVMPAKWWMNQFEAYGMHDFEIQYTNDKEVVVLWRKPDA